MRRLTLSKREKSKGDFLASCSLFSFSIVLLSLTSVAEYASERKTLYEYNASRCLCFPFVCVRARACLSLYTTQATATIDTLFCQLSLINEPDSMRQLLSFFFFFICSSLSIYLSYSR